MVYFSLESDIDGVKAIEPEISGNLIFTLSPNAFLLIEGWLVRRQII
jgi:hypothetical protein